MLRWTGGAANASSGRCELAGLTDRRRDRVSAFPGGMKRRSISRAPWSTPRAVVFLDEPTVGVDPQSRNHIFEAIERLEADGDDDPLHHALHGGGPALCDRVAIMDHGKILALDTVDNLDRAHGGPPSCGAELAEPPAAGADLPGDARRSEPARRYRSPTRARRQPRPARASASVAPRRAARSRGVFSALHWAKAGRTERRRDWPGSHQPFVKRLA